MFWYSIFMSADSGIVLSCPVIIIIISVIIIAIVRLRLSPNNGFMSEQQRGN